MTNVCTHCFSDRELIALIHNQGKVDNCSFCGTNDVSSVSIYELFDYFSELLSHFKVDRTGQSLTSLIQANWSLFNDIEVADKILNYYISNSTSSFSNAQETANFSDEILENIGYWDVLKRKLANESRYITDVGYLTGDLGWDGFFNSQIEIPHGFHLYRARLHHNSGQPPFSVDEMYCPPAINSTAGRANPSGIPYLYLSDNPETVLYEVRATYLDELSVGTFQIQPRVTKPVIISDFTESSTIFHPSKVGNIIKATLLKKKISNDLSKPVRRYDSELEYIPTQFICEFIKIYTNVHGIKFRSSLHANGNNFVIFDQSIMSCTHVNRVKVDRVTINAG
jgi:hypothetical protein